MPSFKPEFTACLTDSHSFLLQTSFPSKTPRETSGLFSQRPAWYVMGMLILNTLLRSYLCYNIGYSSAVIQKSVQNMLVWSKTNVVSQVEDPFLSWFWWNMEHGKTLVMLWHLLEICLLVISKIRSRLVDSNLIQWVTINLFRIKTHAHLHAPICRAAVFLNAYTQTFSFLPCASQKF